MIALKLTSSGQKNATTKRRCRKKIRSNFTTHQPKASLNVTELTVFQCWNNWCGAAAPLIKLLRSTWQSGQQKCKHEAAVSVTIQKQLYNQPTESKPNDIGT